MANSNRFLGYLPILLEALHSADPAPMRPAEAAAWIRERMDVPDDSLTRRIKNGRQTIFENDIHWARHYLKKAGLVSQQKLGQWTLTDLGRQTRLSNDDARRIFNEVRAVSPAAATVDDEDAPAPEMPEAGEDVDSTCWLVGALWDGTVDKTEDFRTRGVWENGYTDRYLDLVRSMRPGDRIVIKSTFVQKNGLPFDVNDRAVSVMRIKATGTILENPGDGRWVRVAWDPPVPPRDWYFYTFRTTISGIKPDDESSRRLIDFIVDGAPQDYSWWLERPYWREKYGVTTIVPTSDAPVATPVEAVEETVEQPPAYDLDDIVGEGCFLSETELSDILERWRAKKNLVLQGPPGTGKTWLAKRLGYAMVGSDDRETTRTRLRIVQFHPSLSYEDFVRGYRPAGDGKLELRDGVMMEAIEAAPSSWSSRRSTAATPPKSSARC